MVDFLMNGGIPVTLVSNMLFFRDSKKSFEINGDLLETMTNKISMLVILIQKIKNYFMNLQRKRILILKERTKK